MRYWIAVASREHVKRGLAGGFCQVCHGKPGPLNLMTKGDGIIYYSPREVFGEKEPCRKFTAIGWIAEGDPYQSPMWRRDVHFIKAHDTEIVPLLGELSFIKDKKRWGFPFRRGCFSVPFADFQLIAAHMGVVL